MDDGGWWCGEWGGGVKNNDDDNKNEREAVLQKRPRAAVVAGVVVVSRSSWGPLSSGLWRRVCVCAACGAQKKEAAGLAKRKRRVCFGLEVRENWRKGTHRRVGDGVVGDGSDDEAAVGKWCCQQGSRVHAKKASTGLHTHTHTRTHYKSTHTHTHTHSLFAHQQVSKSKKRRSPPSFLF